MSYHILHKLAKKLKSSLIQQLDIKAVLAVKDHAQVFCGLFESDNAFKIFKSGIEKDRMYICVFFSEYERIIYFERQLRIEDEDETYQQLQLKLDIPFVNRISERYEIERDYMGDFHNENWYINFSDYLENVLTSEVMSNLIGLYPHSVCISLNADL